MENNFVGQWNHVYWTTSRIEINIVQEGNLLTFSHNDPKYFSGQARIDPDGIVMAWTGMSEIGAGQTRSRNVEYNPITGKPIRVDWENNFVWNVASVI